jgi:vacuolar-type H+-ATPase subunit I/STV1
MLSRFLFTQKLGVFIDKMEMCCNLQVEITKFSFIGFIFYRYIMAELENIFEDFQEKVKEFGLKSKNIFIQQEEDGKLYKEKLENLMIEKTVVDDKLLEYERKFNEVNEMISEHERMIEELKSDQIELSATIYEREMKMREMVSENSRLKDDLVDKKRE